MNKFKPGDLVLWNRNSVDPEDHEVVGMVTNIALSGLGALRIHVRWSDGIADSYPPDTLRHFNPCAAAAA